MTVANVTQSKAVLSTVNVFAVYVEKKHELVTTALNGESNGLKQGSLNINKVPIHNTGWISLRVSKYSPTPKSHKHLMERFYVILLRLCWCNVY